MNKKQYASPKMKTVALKHRANLLECSDNLLCGELGYNQTYADKTTPKV